ncbi:hypothetical protein LDG_5783 [Legionella drancourtii LLAP12]|uniref:Uncharacterized protein n=1 Tax=Legionella drancourtii LLAP12 TaxID=658187 RepID=G9EKP5_9GAMM|nr:hypothetical protein LDG_5783 [Legionella drancourtii LLAP12]
MGMTPGRDPGKKGVCSFLIQIYFQFFAFDNIDARPEI